MKTYVIAIGGNALEENKQTMNRIFADISDCIALLVKFGNRVVLVHGNGPQIGKIVIQNKMAQGVIEENSIDECGAMTQAMMGYTLQKELGNALRERGIRKDIVTVLTQVIVEKDEYENAKPTKPIGPFFSKQEAEELEKKENVPYVEDSGRGYRRVVASPKPKSIEEIEVIRNLLYAGSIVIAGGGGGIPVVETDGKLKGVEAVIDKDYTAELLANEIQADCLILLTGVEYVSIGYNTPNQKELKKVTVDEIKKHIENEEFPVGSMLPKVTAAMRFVDASYRREAVIGTLSKLKEIINGNSGTVIVN